jgi:hypothetical protein
VGVENRNPHEELLQLDRQIQAATELAALKPIYFRLNEIMQAYPADFDVQFTGNDVKQHLMARGHVLKQQETAPLPPPSAAPILSPPPLAVPWPDAAPPPVVPAAPQTMPLSPPPLPFFNVAPPPPAPRAASREKRVSVLVAVAALLVVSVLALVLVRGIMARRAGAAANVEVSISTVPAGASVRVDGGASPAVCTSNCKLALPPGAYQVSASLDGFETAGGAITVSAHQPAGLNLTLQAQAPTVRVLTDLARPRQSRGGRSAAGRSRGRPADPR